MDCGRTASLLRFLALALGVSAAGCGPPSVELTLTLPKTRWEEGESLWYKLQIKNAGWRTVGIDDPSWFSRLALLDNRQDRRRTYLLVMDSSGHEVRANPQPFGMHGEFRFWTDDCGGGVPCDKRPFRPVTLRHGESLTATPSMEAPLRPHDRNALWGLRDARVAPEGEKLTEEQNKALKKLADSLWKYGDPRRLADDDSGAGGVPHGFRILDTLSLPGPGRYRIKAILNTKHGMPILSADDEMAKPDWCAATRPEVCKELARLVREDWAKKAPSEIEELRKLQPQLEREDRLLLYAESNEVDFEVVASSRPGPAVKPPKPLSEGERRNYERILRVAEGET